jgi:hypothetical protein
MILGLVFSAIFVYIGVNLMPELQEVTETAEASGSSGVAGLNGVIMIVFAAVIILGVVKAMAGDDSEEKSVTIKLIKNAKSLIITIERASKNLEQYLNNLDDLLGIQTVIDNDYGVEYGLSLNENKLFICGGDDIWDWYITDKHPEMDTFKVVGLHKKDKEKNLLYVLGRNSEQDNPYLIKLPDSYIEQSDIKECLQYAKVS